MKDLKNPGRRNIRFLLQILVIILLATAAIVASAEGAPVQDTPAPTTLNH